ncbi:uncharacterized protein LOC135167124 [Diachasmimorpha longicaudata]|uniref:uncharacterized protein LOC135167124 n=1 Tax=Diachasmimorpha longicaudata TaxID=58733 RepID=UPI0030B8E858
MKIRGKCKALRLTREVLRKFPDKNGKQTEEKECANLEDAIIDCLTNILSTSRNREESTWPSLPLHIDIPSAPSSRFFLVAKIKERRNLEGGRRTSLETRSQGSEDPVEVIALKELYFGKNFTIKATHLSLLPNTFFTGAIPNAHGWFGLIHTTNEIISDYDIEIEYRVLYPEKTSNGSEWHELQSVKRIPFCKSPYYNDDVADIVRGLLGITEDCPIPENTLLNSKYNPNGWPSRSLNPKLIKPEMVISIVVKTGVLTSPDYIMVATMSVQAEAAYRVTLNVV